MIKVDQEEIALKIKKLKQKAAETLEKAGGSKSAPDVRKARKKVKRAQRKLRAEKAYKAVSRKKTAEAAQAGTPATT